MISLRQPVRSKAEQLRLRVEYSVGMFMVAETQCVLAAGWAVSMLAVFHAIYAVVVVLGTTFAGTGCRN